VRSSTRVVLCALALVLSACGRAAGGVNAAATVNGVTIPEQKLQTAVSARIPEVVPSGRPSPGDFANLSRMQASVLGQMIQDEIVAQAAPELGVQISQEQIDQRFDEVAEQYGGPEGLREEIRKRGLTEEAVRELLAAELRRQALASSFNQRTDVPEEDVRAAYEQRRETEYKVADVSHILLKTQPEAKQVLGELRRGADFAELAKQRSVDQLSAVNGGDLGENPRGAFVPAFDEAVWSAEAGEIVGPVQTQFGFHLIRVEAFRQVPFEDAAGDLREQLQGEAAQAAFDEWFLGVLQQAEVRVDGRFGSWDPSRGTVVPDEGVGVGRKPSPGASPAPTPPEGGPAAPAPSETPAS
jgi:foldase protein PrsA